MGLGPIAPKACSSRDDIAGFMAGGGYGIPPALVTYYGTEWDFMILADVINLHQVSEVMVECLELYNTRQNLLVPPP